MQNETHSTHFATTATPGGPFTSIASNHNFGVRVPNGGESWSHTSIPLSILTNGGGCRQQQLQTGSAHPAGVCLSEADQSDGKFEANEREVNASSSYSTHSSKSGYSALREHDYIGLSSDSSGSSSVQANGFPTGLTEQKFDLVLDSKETELRLGIGPSRASQANRGFSGTQSPQAEAKQDTDAGNGEDYGRVLHESKTSVTKKTGREIVGSQSDVEQLQNVEAASFPKQGHSFSAIDSKGETCVEMADQVRPFHNQNKFQGWAGERFVQAHHGFVQGSNAAEKKLFPSQEVYHLAKEQPWVPHNMVIQRASAQDKSFITQAVEIARQDVLKQTVSQHRGISIGQDVQGSPNQRAAVSKLQSGALDFRFQQAYDLSAPIDKSSFEAAAAKQKYWQGQIPRCFEGFWAPSNQDVSKSTNASELEAGRGNSIGFTGTRIVAPLPKSTVPAKRGFFEALGSMDHKSGLEDSRANVVMTVSAPSPGGKFQGGQGMTPAEGFTSPQGTRHHSAPVMYPWGNVIQLPAGWKMGVEQQPKGAFGAASACNPPPGSIPWQPKEAMGSCETSSGSKETHMKAPRDSMDVPETNQDSQHEEVGNASARAHVVGWPPIRSFRKNTLASHPKPNAEEQEPQPAPSDAPETSSSKLFVKANMDGVPIGRKVDLKAYDSYESLKLALQELFQRFVNGHNGGQISGGNQASSTTDSKQLNVLHASDYVLTHEDRDGDWMLVGDVPWEMFVSTVRRLRIMKSSDAAGLGQRGASKQQK